MSAAVCECGAPMVRRLVAAICGPGMPGPIYELQCSSPEHQAQMLEEQRAERKARDEAAITKAIADGVIDP